MSQRTQSTIEIRSRVQKTAGPELPNPIWERWSRRASAVAPKGKGEPAKIASNKDGYWSTSVSYPIAVSWLPIVEKRIKGSIIPEEYEHDRVLACRSGEWLHEDVARSALDFFSNAADLLPNEPYIYSSRAGNLVAEFDSGSVRLTTVLTPSAWTLMTSDEDGPAQETVDRRSNSVREKLQATLQSIKVCSAE